MQAEPTSITVRVDDQDWQPVQDFDAAAPGYAVYVLDPEAGTVRFGDGQHGRRPPTGSVVTISSGSGVKRPAFFDGQLLSAADFREEQRGLTQPQHRQAHCAFVCHAADTRSHVCKSR